MESCPSEDTIAAFVDRRLRPDGTGRVRDHVAACAACRRLVSDAVRDDVIAASVADTVTGDRAPVRSLGATFGRYRIEAELGAGGMGRVYAAFDPVLERRVALKVLHDVERGGLVREARAMAKLVHPNVVAVHDVGRADGRDYIAMELIDGETLDRWGRQASPRERIAAFVAAGRGLAAAHAAGIVHGDFKPNNVLRGHDGRIVVTDFGLARAIGEVDEHLVVGTPAYMADEQWHGGGSTAASDQFAFCVALWESLTGARPFRGGTEQALRAAVRRGPDALDRAGLPRRLAAILRRGLAVDPAARWPSMATLLAVMPRPRTWITAAAVAGVAVVGLTAVAASALRPAAVVACPPAERDPATVWSPALTRTLPADVASVLAESVARWSSARVLACASDAGVRTRRLACLDNVLTRTDAVRRSLADPPAPDAERVAAQLVDASVCASPEPPRLATALSAAAIAALGGATTMPARDPCGRALARLAAARHADELSAEVRDASDDAITAAEQCGDDRMLFDALLIRASFENNSLVVGPKLRELAQRVDGLLVRVAQPDVVAAAREMAAEVAATDERWDDAFTAIDAAIAGYPPRFARARLHAAVVKSVMLWARGREAEARALIARWRPQVSAIGEAKDRANLAFVDGMAAWLLGDVADGHAQLEVVRATETQPPRTGRDVVGQVVDRAGRPVDGATVALGRQVYADAVGIGLAMYTGANVQLARSGADGRFVFHDAPDVGAVIAERGAERSPPVALADTQRLVLQPTATVRGVVDRHGSAQMMVAIAQTDATLSYGVIAPIAADGRYELRGVPRGRVQIGTLVWHGIARNARSMQPIVVEGAELADIALTVEPGRDVEVVVRSSSATALDGAMVFSARGQVAPRTLVQARGLLASAYAHPVDPRAPTGASRPGDVVAVLAAVPRIATTVCAGAFAGDLSVTAHLAKLNQHVDDLRCRPLPADAAQILIEVPPMRRIE